MVEKEKEKEKENIEEKVDEKKERNFLLPQDIVVKNYINNNPKATG